MNAHAAGRGIAIAWFITLTILAGAGTSAKATNREVAGGPGGKAFSMRCGSGAYMTGIYARAEEWDSTHRNYRMSTGIYASAGKWINGVGLICVPIDAQRRPGEGARKGYAGGIDGAENGIRCASGRGMTDIALTFTQGNGLARQYVDSIHLFCRYDSRNGLHDPINSGDGQLHGKETAYLRCPQGEYAVGLRGRAGSYLDALGLICNMPAVVVQSMPPVSGPIHVLGKRGRCPSGYVWREARASDHVCVTPQSRQRVARENRLAEARRNPNGTFGPLTCISGYVWREAFDGDRVCVEPSIRSLVKEENRLAEPHIIVN